MSITPWIRKRVIDREQAKRRNVAGKVLHTGQKEEYNPEIAAQVFAELFAKAIAYHRRAPGGQEVYVLSIHGTKFRMAAVHFTNQYSSM